MSECLRCLLSTLPFRLLQCWALRKSTQCLEGNTNMFWEHTQPCLIPETFPMIAPELLFQALAHQANWLPEQMTLNPVNQVQVNTDSLFPYHPGGNLASMLLYRTVSTAGTWEPILALVLMQNRSLAEPSWITKNNKPKLNYRERNFHQRKDMKKESERNFLFDLYITNQTYESL